MRSELCRNGRGRQIAGVVVIMISDSSLLFAGALQQHDDDVWKLTDFGWGAKMRYWLRSRFNVRAIDLAPSKPELTHFTKLPSCRHTAWEQSQLLKKARTTAVVFYVRL